MKTRKSDKKHYTIPVFIPELGCPFRCIFCNQNKITGKPTIPDNKEVINIIESHISTIDIKNSIVEIGYFGGNFTGIPIEQQKNYLSIAKEYAGKYNLSGIRISTRPDYINGDILNLLTEFGVTVIELGAQSFDDNVLRLSKRGHTVADIISASEKILNSNIDLGIQIMIGLPGDNLKKSIHAAKKIVELKASNTRIYPVLIIKDTELEIMFKNRKYKALSLEESVKWCTELIPIFEEGNISIIKMGLHPSENLISGSGLIAGPYHSSFRQLVLTEIWKKNIYKIIRKYSKNNNIEVHVSPGEINYAAGYQGKNKKLLMDTFKNVSLRINNELRGREYIVRGY